MREAFERLTHSSPSKVQLQGLLALAWSETRYGQGWETPEQRAAHNWGAVQAGRPDDSGACPVGSFAHDDFRPTASGPVRYRGCFRVYASDVDGAQDVIRIVKRHAPSWAALRSGNVRAFAKAQYEAHYYEGTATTVAGRIEQRVKLFGGAARVVAQGLGEPLYWRTTSAQPTRRGRLAVRVIGPLIPVILRAMK